MIRYQTVRGDNVAGSRFGSALAKVGDVNKDGNEDVAIGSPYEAAAGAVYIYFGEKHATHVLRDEYAQVRTFKQRTSLETNLNLIRKSWPPM